MTSPASPDTVPPGIALAPLALLPVGGAKGFVLELKAGRFEGFVVRTAAGLRGYVDRCPHRGLSLARRPDEYLAPGGGYIACRWHGALFDPETGACLGGPCPSATLHTWPVHIEDAHIVTGPAPHPTQNKEQAP